MIDPKMPINPDIHQAVITPPAIGVDNAVGVDLAADDGLQRGFGGVWDDLGVDAVTALEQRSGSVCLNNFPRFISGPRAGCEW